MASIGVFFYRNARSLDFLGAFLCLVVLILLVVSMILHADLNSSFKTGSVFNGILASVIFSGVAGILLAIMAIMDIMLEGKKTMELVYILLGNQDKSEVVLPPPGPVKEDADIFSDNSSVGSVAIPPEVIPDPAVLMLAQDSQGKWTYKGVEGNARKEEGESKPKQV